jgi:phage shock protein A
VGAALQSTVEDLMNRDLDTGVVVNLANSEEAHRELQDLLPIHFFSWNLENVESALVYTLLHMFVVLGQYGEIVRERSTYQDYISNLKGQVSQLEDELNEIKRQTGAHQYESSKDEVLRLRKENAELRSEQAKLQASQNELFQINDAWSRDYHSLTRKIDALTTGNWSTEICTSGTAAPTSDNARTPTQPPSLTRTPLAHHTSAPCTKCCSLQDQVAELGRQVTEFARRNEGLEKSMTEMERKLKQRELMIKSLDNENQAVQLQVHVYTCIMFNIILISFIYASHKYGA